MGGGIQRGMGESLTTLAVWTGLEEGGEKVGEGGEGGRVRWPTFSEGCRVWGGVGWGGDSPFEANHLELSRWQHCTDSKRA